MHRNKPKFDCEFTLMCSWGNHHGNHDEHKLFDVFSVLVYSCWFIEACTSKTEIIISISQFLSWKWSTSSPHQKYPIKNFIRHGKCFQLFFTVCFYRKLWNWWVCLNKEVLISNNLISGQGKLFNNNISFAIDIIDKYNFILILK